jgi:hypothetical protein
MFAVLVLSSLLLISIVGIIALLSYKMVRIAHTGGEVNINTISGISADVFKNKLIDLFEHTHRKGAHFVFWGGRYVYNKAGKHVSGKFNEFTDSMNGKGDTSKKGAASFFLKSVSEHKKALHDRNE